MEPFVVRQYSEDERPIIKGNGFDGLEIGQDREEAERFAVFVNAAVAAERERCAMTAAIHSQYPVTSDYDKGYAKARADAASAILGKVL